MYNDVTQRQNKKRRPKSWSFTVNLSKRLQFQIANLLLLQKYNQKT